MLARYIENNELVREKNKQDLNQIAQKPFILTRKEEGNLMNKIAMKKLANDHIDKQC